MARLIVLGLISVTLVASSASSARAQPGGAYDRDISDAEIEAALDGWGDWHEDVEHGHVWRPRDVGPDWVPYSRGHWRTAAGDRWIWMSDFAWGRVTFHYGRWFDHPWLGWVWVPGYAYAPSWAAIRTTDDWVSWAPLPPGPCYRGDRLVVIIGDGAWSFGRYHRSRRVFHRAPHRPTRVVRWVTHPRPRWHRAPPPRARRFVPSRARHAGVRAPAPRVRREAPRVARDRRVDRTDRRRVTLPERRTRRVEVSREREARRVRSSPRSVDRRVRREVPRPTRRVETSREREVRRVRSSPRSADRRVRRDATRPTRRVESSRDRSPRRVRSSSSRPRLRPLRDAAPRVRPSTERAPRRVKRSRSSSRVRLRPPPKKVRRSRHGDARKK